MKGVIEFGTACEKRLNKSAGGGISNLNGGGEGRAERAMATSRAATF
jgi:hypothetical protein